MKKDKMRRFGFAHFTTAQEAADFFAFYSDAGNCQDVCRRLRGAKFSVGHAKDFPDPDKGGREVEDPPTSFANMEVLPREFPFCRCPVVAEEDNRLERLKKRRSVKTHLDALDKLIASTANKNPSWLFC
ncbi:predicted protein [Lichtheimia corymbifera JMRC:FSU:9682]|uniref:Uncharacterized protein n=1 Tax=Lichtheimia corymbifera JMRC:FSU:9682 TaxID=1263082 RepID=A0A068S9Q7_9FUNG|nr:predicted protein [Lichtheimia corymbifera JMRC:FSU:9682]